MNYKVIKQSTQTARRRRVRASLRNNLSRPRLHVFRSNKHTYAQIIDDVAGKTIVAAHDREVSEKGKTKVELATKIGQLIAEKALKQKVTQVKFDRGSYRYHGRVKAIAESAREAGLEF